jgi:hypothetical protein
MTHFSTNTPTPECEAYADLLPVLTLPDLDASIADRVKSHVAACAHCQEQVQRYRDVDAWTRRLLGPESVTPFQTEYLMGDITQFESLVTEIPSRHLCSLQTERLWVPRVMVGAISAALVLVLTVTIIIVRFVSHPSPTTLEVDPRSAITIKYPGDFSPAYISPDGNVVIGVSEGISSLGQEANKLEQYNRTTDTWQLLYTPPTGNEISWIQTVDDQQIFLTESPAQTLEVGSTRIPANQIPMPTNYTFVVLDRHTLKTQTLGNYSLTASGIIAPSFLHFTPELSHGMILWVEGITKVVSQSPYQELFTMKIKTYNLATKQIAEYPSPFDNYVRVDWPYMLYSVGHGYTDGYGFVMTNLMTGQNYPIPEPRLFVHDIVSPEIALQVEYRVIGSRILAEIRTGTTGNGIRFMEIPDATQAGASWQEVKDMEPKQSLQSSPDGYGFVTDGRIFMSVGWSSVGNLSDMIGWDSTLHKFIRYTPPANDLNDEFPSFGTWLITGSYQQNAAQEVTLTTLHMIDISHLRFKS